MKSRNRTPETQLWSSGQHAHSTHTAYNTPTTQTRLTRRHVAGCPTLLAYGIPASREENSTLGCRSPALRDRGPLWYWMAGRSRPECQASGEAAMHGRGVLRVSSAEIPRMRPGVSFSSPPSTTAARVPPRPLTPCARGTTQRLLRPSVLPADLVAILQHGSPASRRRAD